MLTEEFYRGVRSKVDPTWNLSPRNSRKTNDSPSDRYESHHVYGLVVRKGRRGFDVSDDYVEPMPIGRCGTVEKNSANSTAAHRKVLRIAERRSR